MTRPTATVSAIRWADSAVRRFVAEHPADASLVDIAQHLGVSRQAVDMHYRSALRWAHVAMVLDEWAARRDEA